MGLGGMSFPYEAQRDQREIKKEKENLSMLKRQQRCSAVCSQLAVPQNSWD